MTRLRLDVDPIQTSPMPPPGLTETQKIPVHPLTMVMSGSSGSSLMCHCSSSQIIISGCNPKCLCPGNRVQFILAGVISKQNQLPPPSDELSKTFIGCCHFISCNCPDVAHATCWSFFRKQEVCAFILKSQNGFGNWVTCDFTNWFYIYRLSCMSYSICNTDYGSVHTNITETQWSELLDMIIEEVCFKTTPLLHFICPHLMI